MISAIYERKNSSLIEFQGKWRICHMTRKYRDSAMTKTIIKQTFPNARSYHMQNECNELLDHDKQSHLNKILSK